MRIWPSARCPFIWWAGLRAWSPKAARNRYWNSRMNWRSNEARKVDFPRLLWIPPGLQIDDERQRKVIDQLRHGPPRLQEGADLLETFLEDLRTVIQEKLKKFEEPGQHRSDHPKVPAETGTEFSMPGST